MVPWPVVRWCRTFVMSYKSHPLVTGKRCAHACDLRIGNGNPNPADGFSINYIRTSDPILAALQAGSTLPAMNNAADPLGGAFSDNGSSGDISLAEEGTQTG